MTRAGAAAARTGRELLRPLSGRPTARTAGLDLLLWAVLCLPPVSVLVLLRGDTAAAGVTTPGEMAIGAALLAVAVALSRPYPVAAALLNVVAVFWVPLLSLALMVLCYLLGRRDPRLWLAAAGCGAAVVVLAADTAREPGSLLDMSGTLIANVIALVLPWMVGSYQRQRRNLDEAGWERARQLEREQRIAADEARLRERSRIAQDMHDSLGHELSLIALRAGALELAPDMAERHRTAAGELRESATTATERLREIVGVLRESGADAPTAPAGEEIAEVVERARRSGVDVVLERSGSWEGVAPMVDRAAHRVVQEGLTNATKHAPRTPVRVRLERSETETAVTVFNSAPPRTGAQPAPDRGRKAAGAAGGGRGLIGLAERVRLAGGTLEAGEVPDGFAVVARFPLGGSPAGAGAGPGADRAPSGADEHMREAQRGLRRRGRRMTAIGAALLVCAIGFAVGGTYLRMAASTLAPADYARLEVGSAVEQLEPRLPGREYEAVSDDESALAARFDCRYYSSDNPFLGREFSVYRLCFGGDELVAKDAVPELGPYPDAAP